MRTYRTASLVTLAATVALVMAAVAGCSDDSSSSSSGGSDTPGSDFFSRYAKAICKRTFACCDAATRAAHDLDVSTEAECSSQLQQVLKAFGGGEKIQATYVPQKGDACIAEVEAVACERIEILGPLLGVDEELVPSCNDAWDGSVAEGETCGTNWDCVRDHCVHHIDPNGEQTSACEAEGAVGEPCESSFDCEDALRCDQPSPPTAGKCAPRLAMGVDCTSSSDCEPALHCADVGTCQPREMQGGSCSFDDDCVEGMACEGSVCQPLGGAGAACDSDSDCVSFACVKPAGTCADVCHGA